MSSLPSWVASAFDFNAELKMAATMPPPIRNETGSAITTTNTMMIGPKSTATFLPNEGPGFDFDERTDRKISDTDRRTRRAMIAELVDVHLVHERVVAHVAKEHGRLGDVRHRRAVGFEVTAQVPERLS